MSEGHESAKRILRDVPLQDHRKVARVKRSIPRESLHRVDSSQLGLRDGVSLGHCINTPRCVLGYGDSNCAFPGCACHAMPIKDLKFPPIEFPIEFAGPEPMTQDEHAEHLELTRPQRTPEDFRNLLAIGTLLGIVWMIVAAFFLAVMPQIFASVFTN